MKSAPYQGEKRNYMRRCSGNSPTSQKDEAADEILVATNHDVSKATLDHLSAVWEILHENIKMESDKHPEIPFFSIPANLRKLQELLKEAGLLS